MAQQPTPNIEGFLAQSHVAAKGIQEAIQKDGFISVFSHLDADGVAAAGVICNALHRLDARYRVRVMQWVDDKIVSEVTADKPNLVILTDFGSGYLDLLSEKLPNTKIVILDHHQINGTSKSPNIVQLNPHTYALDGATDVSGSGVAYFAAKALNPANVDLAPIAFVGALGDMQDKYEKRSLKG